EGFEKAVPPSSSPVTATWSSTAMGLVSPVLAIVKDLRRVVIVAESSRTSPRQKHSASAAWPTAIESIVAPFFLSLRYALYGSTAGPQPIPEPINVVESTSPT